MTHDELLAKVDQQKDNAFEGFVFSDAFDALRAVVELHKPTVQTKDGDLICGCAYGAWTIYPCPTIQAIQEQLK